jgi:hypothetical protein
MDRGQFKMNEYFQLPDLYNPDNHQHILEPVSTTKQSEIDRYTEKYLSCKELADARFFRPVFKYLGVPVPEHPRFFKNGYVHTKTGDHNARRLFTKIRDVNYLKDCFERNHEALTNLKDWYLSQEHKDAAFNEVRRRGQTLHKNYDVGVLFVMFVNECAYTTATKKLKDAIKSRKPVYELQDMFEFVAEVKL